MGNERRLRLIQVAKEFKVGLNTITDFLQKKGIKSDGSPNTLVDAATYAVLEKEFGANRSAAGARDSVRERISQKQTTVTLAGATAKAREEEKEVVVKSNMIHVKDELPQPKILGKIDLSPKAAAGKPAASAKPAEKRVETPAAKPAETPKAAAPAAAAPAPAPASQPAATAASSAPTAPTAAPAAQASKPAEPSAAAKPPLRNRPGRRKPRLHRNPPRRPLRRPRRLLPLLRQRNRRHPPLLRRRPRRSPSGATTSSGPRSRR